jgi:hypothetical protein
MKERSLEKKKDNKAMRSTEKSTTTVTGINACDNKKR